MPKNSTTTSTPDPEPVDPPAADGGDNVQQVDTPPAPDPFEVERKKVEALVAVHNKQAIEKATFILTFENGKLPLDDGSVTDAVSIVLGKASEAEGGLADVLEKHLEEDDLLLTWDLHLRTRKGYKARVRGQSVLPMAMAPGRFPDVPVLLQDTMRISVAGPVEQKVNDWINSSLPPQTMSNQAAVQPRLSFPRED
jgi:hypothetical protein